MEKAGDRKRAKDADSEVIWVEWDDKDPENPFEWTLARRWRITLISCLFSFVSSFAGTSFSMGIPSMRVDLKCSAELASMGLAAFPLGFGFAPLVLAPFSEAYGRYLMYCVTVVVYTIFLIPVSRARNAATIIVCRLIAGLACSTGSTLVGGTIADLFHAKDRGPVMSLFTFTTFLGTSFGPASMGWVALKLGWRWIQYILIIMSVVLGLLVIFLTEETRGSVILSRRAAKLRSSTSDPRYQCRSDAERASLLILIKVSMSRPIYLLATEPVVFSFSLWVGLAWGIMFLTLEAVPDVMGTVYNFNQGEIGLTFLAIALGGAFGHLMNIYQERVYQRTVAKRGPEARLYMACFGGLLLPAGMWIFAFSQGWGYWLGPVCGMVVLFTGIFAVYLAAFNYLADCYNVYASSAMSGQSLARNLCGAIFPLFTQQMYTRLGFQWASFLAGCLAAVLATLPWILMAYGPRIRAASKFAKNLAAHHQ